MLYHDRYTNEAFYQTFAQYYQENKAQFISQKLAHIQLATEKEADAVYQELQKGADFAELAKTKLA